VGGDVCSIVEFYPYCGWGAWGENAGILAIHYKYLQIHPIQKQKMANCKIVAIIITDRVHHLMAIPLPFRKTL
jgi:hypothetical protein